MEVALPAIPMRVFLRHRRLMKIQMNYRQLSEVNAQLPDDGTISLKREIFEIQLGRGNYGRKFNKKPSEKNVSNFSHYWPCPFMKLYLSQFHSFRNHSLEK